MMKTTFDRKKAICIVLSLIIAASIVLFAAITPSGVAQATQWGSKDTSELWYYQQEFLDVDNAKNAVSQWDLSNIEKPVVIAVVDTGIVLGHELFEDVLLKNSDGQILGYNASEGVKSDGTVDVGDESSKHGTSVAGIIAMLIKEFGLEDYIKIYPIKANTKGSDEFKIATLAKALDWASEQMNVDVINLSLGLLKSTAKGTSYDNCKLADRTAFEMAIEQARRTSVLVAAAGNDSKSDSQDVYYPAAMDGVVSVMNQSKDNTIYKTSNYGATYDLCAPGEGIYTAKTQIDAPIYRSDLNGSSASAAFVSFATALLKLRCSVENRDVDATALTRMIRNFNVKTLDSNGQKYRVLDLNTIASGSIDDIRYDYQIPTGMKLVHDGTMGSDDFSGIIYMRASSITPVKFYANLLPAGKTDPDVEKEIEWSITTLESYQSNVVLSKQSGVAYGSEYEFNPERGGDYLVTATLERYGITVSEQIHIEFSTYYSGEVRVTLAENASQDVSEAPSTATLYSTETTTFALTGMQYLDYRVETKWYVNGEYVASGETFDFTPKKAGTYRITAQYGDNKTIDFDYAFVAEVKSFILRPLDLSMLIIGLALATGLAVAVAVIYTRKKKAKATTSDDTKADEQAE